MALIGLTAFLRWANVDDEFLDTQSTPERTILDLRALGFRTMLSCGRYEYTTAQPPLPLQSHSGWLVISYLQKGFQVYEIDGKRVELRGNQVMRIFPGESYGTGHAPEHRGTLFWLIVSVNPPPGPEGAWGLTQDAATELLTRLMNREAPRVETASSLLGQAFARAFSLSAHDTALDLATLRHALALILLELACIRDDAMPVAHLATEVAKRLSEDPARMPNSEELASFSGFPVSTFYERFGKETGMTPKEFAMRWKVNEALKRLRAGDKVIEVAHALGFSSSQYFASVVRRHSGESPSYWRRRKP